MLRTLSKEITYSVQLHSKLKQCIYESHLLSLIVQPFQKNFTRSTYVLRRKYPIQLVKLHEPFDRKRLKPYDYVYEEVKDAEGNGQDLLNILIIKPVPGIGSPGQVVEVRRDIARLDILLPGLGVYASPENLKKYSYLADLSDESKPSSPFALKTVMMMERNCFNVAMNMENPWKIEPWHVRLGFRRAGVHVPEYAISLPENPITGPNLDIEGKEFLVKVKINNKEEALVRMRVHHVATDPLDRLPWVENHTKKLAKPIFPEDAEILEKLNKNDRNMMKPDVL